MCPRRDRLLSESLRLSASFSLFPTFITLHGPQHVLLIIWLKFKQSKSHTGAPLPLARVCPVAFSGITGISHLLVSQTYGCQNSCACVLVLVSAVRTAVGLSCSLPVINKGARWEMRRAQIEDQAGVRSLFLAFTCGTCVSTSLCAWMSSPLLSTACICEHSSEINTGSDDFLNINLPFTFTHTVTCAIITSECTL